MKKILAFILIIAASSVYTGCSTALHKAVSEGQTEIVKKLIEEGADINSTQGVAGTPINTAAYHGQTETVKLLLDKGANVNDRNDSGGWTPLTNAARNGHTDVVKLLLDRGADIDSAIRLVRGNSWATHAIEILEEFRAKRIASQPVLPKKVAKVVTFHESIKSDVDQVPSIKAQTNKNAYAIVIGIEQYRQKLPKADFAVADAKTISEYLTKTMGYPEENVITLLNDRALKSDLEKYFDRWLSNNVEENGRVFIYYSGHGAPNAKTGDAYLVPYDGDPTFITETGYSLARLYESLGKLPAKEIIVVLDSCFSGGGGRSVLAKGAKPLVITIDTPNIKKNIAVMTASSGDEISSAYEERGHGLFTYFLLKGIKDENVIQQDGSIKMDDLFGYIKPQVKRIARKQFNNEQTPQLIGAKKN